MKGLIPEGLTIEMAAKAALKDFNQPSRQGWCLGCGKSQDMLVRPASFLQVRELCDDCGGNVYDGMTYLSLMKDMEGGE